MQKEETLASLSCSKMEVKLSSLDFLIETRFSGGFSANLRAEMALTVTWQRIYVM